jgi:hypothetical protein
MIEVRRVYESNLSASTYRRIVASSVRDGIRSYMIQYVKLLKSSRVI